MILLIAILGSIVFLIYRTFTLSKRINLLKEKTNYTWEATVNLTRDLRAVKKQQESIIQEHKKDTERIESEIKKIYEIIKNS